MRIDIQVLAHLRQQVAADFFLAILEGGEFFAEVQTAMAALTFIGHKLAGDLACGVPTSVLAARTPHPSQIHSRTQVSERQAKNKCVIFDGRLLNFNWQRLEEFPESPRGDGFHS